MNKPTAYGSFKKAGGNIYRTSAYIQWGNSDKSLGACLLLNPGSAALEESLEEIFDKHGIASGSIRSTDPTMNQLIALVEKIYQSERVLSGRLDIYNLFNLQNTSAYEAINQFEELVRSGHYNIKGSVVSTKELQLHPWIIVLFRSIDFSPLKCCLLFISRIGEV
ncbi:hypothetical protein GLW07_12565 [Bacillus hwajinpoensis]|uniref:Uncharacterized protein n=1 Tax=Guptibacillus hwajinpoensis TaxID=208199 RepID=A0A845F0D4_9BACL|nr:hypothetical protein [Pseudalkalibacillus hwajinpoensis]MYL64185.1 hypothetical protein [Pseudalkalibacillus hwajinpoensis]